MTSPLSSTTTPLNATDSELPIPGEDPIVFAPPSRFASQPVVRDRAEAAALASVPSRWRACQGSPGQPDGSEGVVADPAAQTKGSRVGLFQRYANRFPPAFAATGLLGGFLAARRRVRNARHAASA